MRNAPAGHPPPPPPITNPLVRQALYEVRKVVNAIIREYGRLARIHIELAREIKGTAKDRERRSKEMRQREQERDRAADEVRKAGVKVSRDAIDRYLLWQEWSALRASTPPTCAGKWPARRPECTQPRPASKSQRTARQATLDGQAANPTT